MIEQKTEWSVLEKVSQEDIDSFSELHPTLVQLLFNRELKTQAQIDEFLNPDFDQDLHDPYLMKDMERGVQRIIQAIENKETVGIFGDYDADGVTSSVILTELLKALGLQGYVYLPDREKDGYGLNTNAVDYFKEKGITLIITCDCGVSNKKQIDYAKDEQDLDVVVFDHHHVPEEFSDEYIIINPKRNGDKYPFKDMCAAGVVFKLVEAFYRHEPEYLQVENKEAFVKWLLDLVAIGTVADCMPILHENRTLVAYGLQVLNKTKRLGLKKLYQQANIGTPVTTFHIGFMIAPRINAAGRIDHANTGFKLMLAENESEAQEYAFKLEETNNKRRSETEKVSKEAQAKISEKDLEKNIIIVHDEKWPMGVLGIVAGKLTQKYVKPVIVMSGTDEIVGSGRGPEAFSIVEAFGECKDLLVTFGGHRQAAGLTVSKEKFQEFKEKMESIAAEKLTEADLVKKMDIEAEIELKDVGWELWDAISRLQPFGQANAEPLFAIHNLTIAGIATVGSEGKHLKLTLKDEEGNKKKAIGFNLGFHIKNLAIGDQVSVAGCLTINEWNGNRELELRIADVKKK